MLWKAISQVLADQFGAYYTIKHKTQIHDAELNQTWVIDDGNLPVFVKINDKSLRSMFRAEADQLTLLAKTKTLRVPQVYGVGCSQSHSFLLLEYLPLQNIDSQYMTQFGEQLAALHRYSKSENYGLDFDTWLGAVHQPNDWKNNWAKFFSEQRIGWQLQICREKGIDFGNINDIVKASARKLVKHNPPPALLHGNLWVENFALSKHLPVCYDPACYWGDRECDLAFSELFEPLPPAFYQAYNTAYPLSDDYPIRRPLYQLYYLLNFSHRFKGHYIELTQKFVDRLLNDE